MLETLLMAATMLTTNQEWEFIYDGEVYAVECDLMHIHEAEFVTIDGVEVSVMDVLNGNL